MARVLCALTILSHLQAAHAGYRSLEIDCEEVIVGGGWAGVYFAYRRATSVEDPSKICVFERTKRIGGRTYSVPVNDTEFTLDVGAYRFSPDMHLPGDLILKHFQLPTECYEPNCPDASLDFPPPFLFNYSAPMLRIVDNTTRLPSGYVTAIYRMTEKMKELGAHIFLGHELIDFAPAPLSSENSTLLFASTDGQVKVESQLVMLNLPRNYLLALPGVLRSLRPRVHGMLKCIVFDEPKSLFKNTTSTKPTSALSKAYFYYSDAWWHTKINRTVGETPSNAFNPLPTSSGIFYGIHWNDGPVVCSDDAMSGKKRCHGFLETYYAVTNETFFASISGQPTQPLGLLRAGNPTSDAIIARAHTALLEFLEPILLNASVAPEEIPKPELIVVGVWERPSYTRELLRAGYTAPTKVYYAPELSGSLAKACNLNGLTEDEYQLTVLQPFGRSSRIFLANNDYVALNVHYLWGDWAEESLLMAERALFRLGAAKPEWLDKAYYHKKVAIVEMM
ncbi:hypothetical protein CYMTET_42081 [Cymbomonas tetramitiformis]|uniref:Amine oxidase domain-containing protein n=1 Tax=Cymbomonas tetramitiformis TaxID=36881 RepID=A0AAE0F2Y1_9CHLO|nr:hypothetical protein CYMTET_42081 [Cymbomonas tetramitiformis]|eukprot:gene22165-26715_t